MAEVLTVPSNGQEFGSPLRRSSSQPSLLLDTQVLVHATREKSDSKAAYRLRESARSSVSAPSSGPSSPRFSHVDFSNRTSCLSTPSSSLSLDDAYEEEDYGDDGEEEEFAFALYGSAAAKSHSSPKPGSVDSTPRASPSREQLQDEDEDDPASAGSQKNRISRSDSMNLSSIADDTAAKPQPTRHVDYLSHDWREEDIWCSWRHVVAKRGCLDNWERLENASWRTWMKTQKHLATINPDRLNWMKDHDVTWLYGPLQTGMNQFQDSTLRSALSRTDSFIGKKPILKKRSISEVMLQRSISSQSLMRQATDSIRAQEAAYASGRPSVGTRGFSDYCPRPSPATSNDQTVPESPSPMASYASLDSDSPDEGRHIHFNETVEQCIAISSDSDEPDYDDSVFEEEEEHSSDDEFLTMKTNRTLERKLSRNSTPRNSFSDGCISGKTIAMLPTTKLKCRAETPSETLQRGGHVGILSPTLRESSSQATLRPTRPHANFLIDDDSDEYDLDPDWNSNERSTTIRQNGQANTQHIRFASSSPRPSQIGLDVYRDDNDELQHPNMRRTPSGMFMPYEEGDEQVSGEGEGLLGKVVDTYNTARDIAHVIWNVGWRR